MLHLRCVSHEFDRTTETFRLLFPLVDLLNAILKKIKNVLNNLKQIKLLTYVLL